MHEHIIEKLNIRPGITAVIGSGGKTTLLRQAAETLPGTVILTTSTHIFPFDGIPLYTGADPDALRDLLARERVVCVGTPSAGGKLTAPSVSFEELAVLADYVIVEADGSKHKPLKAHAPHEPVIPAAASDVIRVIGAHGFGLTVSEAVHRPEIFCEAMQVTPGTIVTEEMYMDFLEWERANNDRLSSQLAGKEVTVWVNNKPEASV